MTTFDTRILRCIICGQENQFTITMSTNSFGSMDLDTRPPEMKRSTLPFSVQECSSCHYCNTDISKKIVGLNPEILKSAEYLALLGDSNCGMDTVRLSPRLIQRRFLMSAYLYASVNDDMEAGSLYLNAAWLYDDLSQTEKAVSARKKAAEHIKKALLEKENIGMSLVLVDVLRRAGEFTEALEYAETLKPDDELLDKILTFQKKRIKHKDTLCYKVSDT